MLEDGKVFTGEMTAGVSEERIGEVLFNTSLVGYQEILTDPANAGKILVFTSPSIGNYGTCAKFSQSNSVWAVAAVVKEISRSYSNCQAKAGFTDFARENGLLTLTGVETRSLAMYLRKKGQMLGIISPAGFEAKDLLKKIDEQKKKPLPSFLEHVSIKTITALGKARPKQKRLAILDLGMTRGIRKQLEKLGLHLTLLPFNTTAQEILELEPHGLIISGGPEQDPRSSEICRNISPLVGKLPILGISTGLHILAGCLGAKTVKMKRGHHGANYPVHDPASYKGEITSQSHSYAVDADSLPRIKDLKVAQYNLNDRTVERIESKKLRLIGIQYEARSPGLDEVNPVFTGFLKMLKRVR
jgi:carbamoyl-phosphate synthase small subunit